MKLSGKEIPKLKSGVYLKDLGGRKLLLIPEGYVELNETAYAILSKCDGNKSIEDIVKELKGMYAGSEGQIREDVIEVFMELHKEALIDFF